MDHEGIGMSEKSRFGSKLLNFSSFGESMLEQKKLEMVFCPCLASFITCAAQVQIAVARGDHLVGHNQLRVIHWSEVCHNNVGYHSTRIPWGQTQGYAYYTYLIPVALRHHWMQCACQPSKPQSLHFPNTSQGRNRTCAQMSLTPTGHATSEAGRWLRTSPITLGLNTLCNFQGFLLQGGELKG